MLIAGVRKDQAVRAAVAKRVESKGLSGYFLQLAANLLKLEADHDQDGLDHIWESYGWRYGWTALVYVNDRLHLLPESTVAPMAT